MNDTKPKITVVGSGYVGMAMSAFLSQICNVTVYDIDLKRVKLINQGISTVDEAEIHEFLNTKNLNLHATSCKKEAFKNAQFIILAVPTNFDEVKNFFDTSILDQIIKDIKNIDNTATIIIKSTIPIGYTSNQCRIYNTDSIIFSPEFLREGQSLYDCLNPSRIILGSNSKEAQMFAKLLSDASEIDDPKILFMSSKEAESVKLFSNSYLAMRVAFFNELDSFSYGKGLNTKNIIEGVSSDPRIGDYYNNPSFGYGGYCLPKDTKQLLNSFENIPQILIEATINSNAIRKNYLRDMIIKLKPNNVGIYRLIMKADSDNFRYSAILDLINGLKDKGINLIIYEPNYEEELFENIRVLKDIGHFKKISDIIVANRSDHALNDVRDKIFTRDIFGVS